MKKRIVQLQIGAAAIAAILGTGRRYKCISVVPPLWSLLTQKSRIPRKM